MIKIDGQCQRSVLHVDGGSSPAKVALSFGLLMVASCSGDGGGGAGTNLQSNPKASFLASVAEPSSPAAAGDWSGSQEYQNSTGLAQLKAAEGYARRTGGLPGGQGVRIAIIDSGIDVTHPDLGNIAGSSWAAGGEALVGDSHATFVAGIAGASRTQSSDPNDIHGIAYRSTLVNFQAARPSATEANGFVSFGTSDLVDAIRAASGLSSGEAVVESDILNLSLGAVANNDSTFSRLRSAMREAADEDKIIVLAAGNEGLSSTPEDKLQPIYPAAYADDSGIAGLAIVVGNLTSTDEAAASSNHCGDTKNYCLFAPGTAIRSTVNGGAYGIGSGTSFAAPYVAGAAAVVKAAFPGVSSEDVVNRLLLTAADLGDAGVDSTFGRGRLDLEAAMAPVGPTAIPVGSKVDGPSAAIEDSHLRLGSGLSLDASAAALLKRVMAVDSMGFPFPVDLGKAISTTKRDSGLYSFIANDSQELAAIASGPTRLAAFVDDDGGFNLDQQPSSTSLRSRAEDNDNVPMRFSADVTDRFRLFLSLDDSGSAQLGLESGLFERGATLMQTGDLFSPHQDGGESFSGGGMSFHPLDGTTMAISALTSSTEQQRAETSLQRFEVMQALPGGIDARLGIGLAQEEGQFMGSQASGAFGSKTSARSEFLSMSLLGAITDDVDWFASYSRGRGSIGDVGDTLVKDWSDTRSEAFGAGLIIRDVARDDDGLTLAVGQPLRQERAEATIDLPIARQPDGEVVTARERLDLSPEAREIATEIGYQMRLGESGDHQIRAAGFFRLNPDHDAARDPETGIGLNYRWRF